jgi:hypothetical protein
MSTLSVALGGVVALLALLSVATGFCTGCALYRLGARLRALRVGGVVRLDLADLGVPAGRGAVVQFTHPLCSDCHELERRLRARGEHPVIVDVTRRPDLARRYRVATVPFAVRVEAGGTIRERLTG